MFEILFSGLTPRTFRAVTDTFEHVSFFYFFLVFFLPLF